MLGGNSKFVRLENCVIDGEVDIANSGVEFDEKTGQYPINKGLVCDGCVFTQSVNFSSADFNRHVSFRNTQFSSDVNFSYTTFGVSVDFNGCSFARNTTFSDAEFSLADFGYANFLRQADFNGARFRQNALFFNSRFQEVSFFQTAFTHGAFFSGTSFNQEADFTLAEFARPAVFSEVQYVPNTFPQYLRRKPTEFHLNSHDIDEVSNPLFKRYIADQQFIEAFRQKQPGLVWLWKWTSDYGRSLGLWAFWSVLVVVGFGLIYHFPLNSDFQYAYNSEVLGTSVSLLDFIYYSVGTFTSVGFGFGEIIPTQPLSKIAVIMEVLLGYIMLGGFISILINKLRN